MQKPIVTTSQSAGEVPVSRRSFLRIAVLSAIAAIVSACARPPGPGWTYAPAPTTPRPSAPVGTPTPPAPTPPTPSGSGPEIRLVAENIKFDQADFTVPANTPFRIVLENRDAGVPHNVSIYQGKGGTRFFQGEIFNGVATRTYQVPGLPAGNQYFVCDVHPTLMFGTVKVV
jgi:hypothetical protein